ncbi:MAG: phospho-N-acetylmuramoyl-pentapeptide-transferase [Anaerococcus sp.]|uniref:phospho-N-acetylmuramoyl-pentapeptide- transferase n=1 Tax=Anaerococcus sp. TaxID=1872515 RepID=UPI002903ED0C|nr:phospho-N-acetylmuramoyl-pentapeptide-transferase [Anaerococcus sp.]MDU2353143.1 phospho-N-acetylmuramoyl-pentapeptide-transferase [Anaerococcus sp.]
MEINMNLIGKISIITIIATVVLGYAVLPILKNMKIGQNIRKEGPKSHYQKAGTPTMGGIIFLISALLMTLIFVPFNMNTAILLICTLGFGAIGFIDDFRKLVLKQSEGLTPKEKMILQFVLAILVTIMAYINDKESVTTLQLLFTNHIVDISFFGFVILIFIIIGTTNAVNLTDGLDGLATSVSLPVFICLFLLATTETTRLFSIIMFAALLGFLYFNSNPASVFMGDTGSMAIGGAVVAVAIIEKLPIYLIIFGGVYVMETLSVIIQVISYKTRNKKRVFLMTPIHHHFELKGYKEPQIVAAFSIVSTILCLITLVAIL